MELNAQEIWKLFKETDRQTKKTDLETKRIDRETKKLDRETKKIDRETKKIDRETKKLDRETKKLDREIKEQIKEINQLIKESMIQRKDLDLRMKETDRRMKETDRRLKKAEALFTTQWGKLMESLVEGDLIRLLQEKGIQVERTSNNETGRMNYIDEKGKKQQDYCEIDIIAKNGLEIVAVEVKTTLGIRSVKKFLDILKRFPQLFPEYKDKKIYGAVAYLRSQSEAHYFAEKQGLFVIRATGNSSSIINQKKFKPKVFN